MVGLRKRERGALEAFDPFARFDRLERFFDDWPAAFGFRRLLPFVEDDAEWMIRVDELREKDALVIRAELPGIDPDKDVEITVTEGMLHIKAERHGEESTEEKGYVRRELHHGTFVRSLLLPEGVTGDDVQATYTDGILEIRVPIPATPEPEVRTIPIAKKT